MARSWSVILASALTTTTGRSGRRSRTMAATRSMACASCTEVPPNFMTIIGKTSTTEARRHGERQGDVYLLTEPFCFLQRDKCQDTTSAVPRLEEKIWPLGPDEVFCRRG